MQKSLKSFIKYGLLLGIIFISALTGCLYYLLATTGGAKYVVDKVNANLSDVIKISADIKEGSIATGFKFDTPLKVELVDVVTIRADKLNVHYNIMDCLSKNALVFDTFTADKVEVELLDTPSDENESAQEETSSDDTPFRLDFITHIFIPNLDVKDFVYLSSIVDVRVPKAQMALEAFDDNAFITSGKAEGVLVHLKYESTESEPNNLPKILTFDNGNGAIEKITDIELPLNAYINNLDVSHAKYYMDGFSTGYFDAHINANWRGTLLSVPKINIRHALGDVSVRGTMDFIDYYNLDFDVAGYGAKTHENKKEYEGGLYDLKGIIKVKGNLTDLSMDANVLHPQKIDFGVRLNSLSNELPMNVYLKSKEIIYPFHDLTITEKEKALVKEYPQLSGLFDSLNSLQSKVKSEIEKAKAKSSKEPTDTLKSKNAKSTTNDVIKARLNKNTKLVFSDTDFSYKGALFDESKVLFKTRINGYGFKDLNVNVDTDLDTDNAHFNDFCLKGKLGNKNFDAKVDGDFEFADNLTFAGNVNLNAQEARDIHPMLEGPIKLSSDINVSYDSADDKLAFVINEFNADFYLNQNATTLKVNSLVGDTKDGFDLDLLAFDQAHTNKITVKGSLSETSNLNGIIGFNDISLLEKSVKGTFDGRITVKNNIKNPRVNVVGRSNRITAGDFSISKLLIDSNVDIEKETFANSFITDSVRVAKGIKAYRKCALDVSGTVASHRLTLSCGASSGSYVSVKGEYDKNKKTYDANVSNLIIVSNVIDPISLLEPVNIHYSIDKKQGKVSDVILSDGNANIVISETSILENGIKTRVNLDKLKLVAIEKYLPDNVKTSGELSVHSDIEYINNVPNIKAKVIATRGRILVSDCFIPYKTISLDTTMNAKSAKLDAKVELFRDNGNLNVNLRVLEPYSTRKLDGDIKLDKLNLNLFTSASTALNSLDGEANVDGHISGSLEKPLFNGLISVKGSAHPRLNVGVINDFDVKVKANGATGDLDGVFSLNDVKSYLRGTLNWQDGAKGALTFDAEKLPVFLLSYGEVTANVHTKAKLDDHISVQGDIEIPQALIKISNLESGAIAPSSDEIFVDDNASLRNIVAKNKEKTLNNDMELDVNLNLGDKVKVDAMGLKADALGGIRITKESTSNKIVAKGKIYLDEGRAELYGHKFLVNRADAIFKSSIDNPMLDAEVVIDPSAIEDNVVAGVRVKGPAKNPQITLFSKPAMSQNEILSYLLYGHGLEKNMQSSNSDNSSAQLLMSLGLGTTTGILNSVAGIFGMQGVQIGSSGNGDDSQVEVQTYITNRLRLSYGYGVFNSVNEFKLRYELVRRLYVEFVSAIDESVDLIYSFEID